MFRNRKHKRRSSNIFGRIESLEKRELMYGADCLATAPLETASEEDIAGVHGVVDPAPATDDADVEQVKANKKDRWAEIVEIIDRDLEELTEWTIKT